MNLKTEPTHQNDIPKTLEETHAALEHLLSKDTLKVIDSMNDVSEMSTLHFSTGLNLRNFWLLWKEGTPLRVHLESLGFTHPDDMSGAILNSFWHKRHGTAYDLAKDVRVCREHWKYVAEQSTTTPQVINHDEDDDDDESQGEPVKSTPLDVVLDVCSFLLSLGGGWLIFATFWVGVGFYVGSERFFTAFLILLVLVVSYYLKDAAETWAEARIDRRSGVRYKD